MSQHTPDIVIYRVDLTGDNRKLLLKPTGLIRLYPHLIEFFGISFWKVGLITETPRHDFFRPTPYILYQSKVAEPCRSPLALVIREVDLTTDIREMSLEATGPEHLFPYLINLFDIPFRRVGMEGVDPPYVLYRSMRGVK